MKLFLALAGLIMSVSLSAQEKPAAPATPEKSTNPVVVMNTSHGNVTIELLEKEAPETVQNFIGLAEGTKEFTDPTTGEKVKKPFYDGLIFHRVIKEFMVQGGCPLGSGMGDPGYKFKDEINADSLGLQNLKVIDEKQGLHEYLRVYPQQRIQQMIAQPIFTKLGINSQETFQAKQAEFQEEIKKRVETLTIKKLYEGMGYKYDESLTSSPMKTGFLAMANSGPNTNGSQFYINLKDNRYLDGKHTVFGKVIDGMDVVEKIATVKTGAQDKPEEDVKIISIRLKK